MRAVWLRRFGGPEVLRVEGTTDPEPGAGQVLIDIERTSLTFVETQVRAGRAPFPVELPIIPGNGVGGMVIAAGPGADDALVGQRVVTTTGGSGGHAELVLVDANLPIVVPDGLSLDDATALLADGRTAMMLLDAVPVGSGDRVAVLAAAGGLGTLLLQGALAAGADVVGVAGGDRKTRLVEALGAAAADHTRSDWQQPLGMPDVVFDGVGGSLARLAFATMRPGGRIVSYGMASGEWAGLEPSVLAERQVTSIGLPAPSPEQARELSRRALDAANDGRLAPVVGQRFPLDGIARAHEAVEARATLGKTLLTVG